MYNKKHFYQIMNDEQIKQCMEVTASSAKSKIEAGKSLARFFEMDISIKIFGVEIFHWHFPPESCKNPPM